MRIKMLHIFQRVESIHRMQTGFSLEKFLKTLEKPHIFQSLITSVPSAFIPYSTFFRKNACITNYHVSKNQEFDFGLKFDNNNQKQSILVE